MYRSKSHFSGYVYKLMAISHFLCTRLFDKIVRGPLVVKAPQNVNNKSILASEVAVSMFLRLQQSIYLKMQNNQHGNAIGCHSTTTESVSISMNARSHYRCTVEVSFIVSSRLRGK